MKAFILEVILPDSWSKGDVLYAFNIGAQKHFVMQNSGPAFVAVSQRHLEDPRGIRTCTTVLAELPIKEPPMTVYEWIVGDKTGTSSKTIWAHFVSHSRPGGTFGAMTPSDPEDFLRCYWLLKIAPEWRERIGEMGQRYPEWKPLTDNWDELEKMLEEVWPKSCASGEYERDEPPAKAMYSRMQVLLGEGREILRKVRAS